MEDDAQAAGAKKQDGEIACRTARRQRPSCGIQLTPEHENAHYWVVIENGSSKIESRKFQTRLEIKIWTKMCDIGNLCSEGKSIIIFRC